MNNDKLQSLLVLGLDERTPPNEALNALRAAAKHWQDTPRAPTDEEIRHSTTEERLMVVFSAEFEKVKQLVAESIDKSYRDKLNQLEQERDAARTDRDRYKAKLGDVQRNVKSLVAFATENNEPVPAKPAPPPKSYTSPMWNNGVSLLDLDIAIHNLHKNGRE